METFKGLLCFCILMLTFWLRAGLHHKEEQMKQHVSSRLLSSVWAETAGGRIAQTKTEDQSGQFISSEDFLTSFLIYMHACPY